jgi:putative oxidoreductase
MEETMKRWLETDRSWVLFAQRVMLGLVILPHGLQKLLGWFGGAGFEGTMGFFSSQGMPAPIGLLVIVAESLGALALVAGLFTRVAAFGIAAVMLGAIALVHAPNGFFMNWFGTQGGEGFEFHLLALALAVPLVARGGGLWSLDAQLARWLSRAPAGEVARQPVS